MFWCVPGTIGKVFHEVLLKIFEVFFVEPSILLKAKGIFSKSFYVEKSVMLVLSSSHQCILVLPLWCQFS